jgi:hypothetical protein
MSHQEVQISLPIAIVRKAWRKYIGLGSIASDGEDGVWHSDDGRDLTATFTDGGTDRTTLTVQGPDAVDAGDAKGPAELVEGFVAYVNSVHSELAASRVATAGDAPVGPDGAPHIQDLPTGLGTDGRNTDGAGQWEQSSLGE